MVIIGKRFTFKVIVDILLAPKLSKRNYACQCHKN